MIAIGTLLATHWTAPHSQRESSTCGPASDVQMNQIVEYVQNRVSDPNKAALRAALKLPSLDPAEVGPVLSNSTCDRAAQLINRMGQVRDTTSRIIYLVRAGSVYVAEDPKNKSGEWTRVFIMDTAFVAILAQTGR